MVSCVGLHCVHQSINIIYVHHCIIQFGMLLSFYGMVPTAAILVHIADKDVYVQQFLQRLVVTLPANRITFCSLIGSHH